MNKALWDKIDKTAIRIKKGEKFDIVFKTKKNGKNVYSGIIAGLDGRSVQFWNEAVNRWESFSLYELFHIFGATIRFKRKRK